MKYLSSFFIVICFIIFSVTAHAQGYQAPQNARIHNEEAYKRTQERLNTPAQPQQAPQQIKGQESTGSGSYHGNKLQKIPLDKIETNTKK